MPGAGAVSWPRKTRDLHNHHFDSTVWDELHFRDDDIVIATYAKTRHDLDAADRRPAPFGRCARPRRRRALALGRPARPAQGAEACGAGGAGGRRFVKTHLPVDALVFSPRAKYLYIGRDGRDVVWSLYNHHRNANAAWYEALNDTPGLVGPPIEPPPELVRDYFLQWLDRDGHPFWSFWENVASWWAIRDLPNLLLVHFADLKADLPGQIRRIAAFLDVDVDPARVDRDPRALQLRLDEAPRRQGRPARRRFWEGGAADLHPPRHQRPLARRAHARDMRPLRAAWRAERLGEDCARWLARVSASTCLYPPNSIPSAHSSPRRAEQVRPLRQLAAVEAVAAAGGLEALADQLGEGAGAAHPAAELGVVEAAVAALADQRQDVGGAPGRCVSSHAAISSLTSCGRRSSTQPALAAPAAAAAARIGSISWSVRRRDDRVPPSRPWSRPAAARARIAASRRCGAAARGSSVRAISPSSVVTET